MEQSRNDGNGSPSQDLSREIRIALVLYGGVSLAVYENGVTKAFFDLVRGKGVFNLLLELLDATAVVDVIAGTSAGGINGLLLATALSAGSEFDETANLWREHGDIGALMRPVSKADKAESLLDGEGYYQEKLQSAFKMLLEKGNPKKESTGEIDVFITGTDLAGHLKTCWDQLGSQIDDKDHRVVFQLKYRPGRRRLGLTSDDVKVLEGPGTHSVNASQRLIEKQSTILASIARITSTFPAAFPPFRLTQINEHLREDVRRAIESCGALSGYQNISHIYVDGGVLDNKPFGPLLRAIFYRVPYGLVDRRLFYVEPDPEHITRLGAGDKERLINPVGTVISCLTSIPAYQSISEDLERLREHNSRVRWLKRLKVDLAKRIVGQPQPISCAGDAFQEVAYCRTRIDSITRTLLLEVDAVPSAGDYMINPAQELLYESLIAELAEIGKSDNGMARITSCDIDYHVRRVFHVLYKMYASLGEATDGVEKTRTTMIATSRIVKLLKLIRDMLFMLRDRTVPLYLASGNATPQTILDVFVPFLAAEAPHWSAVAAELRNGFNVEMLAARDKGLLSSHVLSQVAQAARSRVDELAGAAAQKTATGSVESAMGKAGEPKIQLKVVTILDTVEEVLKRVVLEWQGNDSCLDEFKALDQVFFPLEFGCGIHELDEIELVRISPKDAQTGLSYLQAQKKVTGDELAHFAAFFRRDWRSNDILWGRLDGICQIVNALLDKDALDRLQVRKEVIKPLLSKENIRSILPGCPESVRKELEEASHSLAAALEGNPEIDLATAFEDFKKKLILAGQHEAVCMDLKGIYEDLFFQETCWGNCNEDKTTVTDAAGPQAMSAAAKVKADEVLRAMEGEDLGETFRRLEIGSQTVAGKSGRVPLRILGEYISHAYLLLWGMLEAALGGHKAAKGFFGSGRLRLFFRSPILFTYNYIWMMRTEKRLVPVLLGALCAALFASGVTGIVLGNLWFLIPLIIPFLLIAIYNRLRWVPSKPSKSVSLN